MEEGREHREYNKNKENEQKIYGFILFYLSVLGFPPCLIIVFCILFLICKSVASIVFALSVFVPLWQLYLICGLKSLSIFYLH
jgi:uncharacterized membrane protein